MRFRELYRCRVRLDTKLQVAVTVIVTESLPAPMSPRRSDAPAANAETFPLLSIVATCGPRETQVEVGTSDITAPEEFLTRRRERPASTDFERQRRRRDRNLARRRPGRYGPSGSPTARDGGRERRNRDAEAGMTAEALPACSTSSPESMRCPFAHARPRCTIEQGC